MPHLRTDDGIRLYYEQTGAGTPIVFVHEFAGDYRSWEPQVRALSRTHRCITYNARGDIRAVLDALNIDKAHIVGLSMGGFACLHFGIAYGQRARSLVIAGCGYGANLATRQQFADEAELSAKRFETLGIERAAEAYALGPARVQFQNKDPRGWHEFVAHLAEHSALGSANTLRGVQK